MKPASENEQNATELARLREAYRSLWWDVQGVEGVPEGDTARALRLVRQRHAAEWPSLESWRPSRTEGQATER